MLNFLEENNTIIEKFWTIYYSLCILLLLIIFLNIYQIYQINKLLKIIQLSHI